MILLIFSVKHRFCSFTLGYPDMITVSGMQWQIPHNNLDGHILQTRRAK